jgi:indolepyruvate ferredoxin oxidoreductase beta subunit
MEELKALIKAKTGRFIAFDGIELAREAGNVMSLNIVLLGALIQTNVLDLSAESVKKAIETTTKQAFIDTNLKAFELGYQAAENA